jgi:Kef-type K+ transport system membrane component KefB
LLGPSALGRWGAFRRVIFPPWSTVALDTVSGLGLLLFLLQLSLEVDFCAVRRVAVAAAGIVPPFLAAPGLVSLELAVTAPPPAPPCRARAAFLPLCVFLGAHAHASPAMAEDYGWSRHMSASQKELGDEDARVVRQRAP